MGINDAAPSLNGFVKHRNFRAQISFFRLMSQVRALLRSPIVPEQHRARFHSYPISSPSFRAANAWERSLLHHSAGSVVRARADDVFTTRKTDRGRDRSLLIAADRVESRRREGRVES